jgi:hypothetical protein
LAVSTLPFGPGCDHHVQPKTVIRWHRREIRAYWHGKSRHLGGRPRIDSEIRALSRRMNRAFVNEHHFIAIEPYG